MKVAKTQCEITNGKPDKENVEDGGKLTYEIGAVFCVTREAIDDLVAVPGFTDQFYNGDDTRLEVVYPLNYGDKIEGLRASLHVGLKPMVFEGATIRPNMKLTPQVGQYVKVECKIKVYPTRDQAGRLDEAVKDYIDIAIEPMTGDMLKAVNA